MLEISMSALALLSQILTGVFLYNPVNSGAGNETYEELYCLAINSYWEARGESLEEKLAIAQVVMNRVENNRYPDDVCSVITQGPKRESWKTQKNPSMPHSERKYFPVLNRCQFSWFCDGRTDSISNLRGWEDSVISAYLVYTGYGEDKVNGATHYYAHKKVTPRWADAMVVTAKLRGHTYLK